MYRPRYLDNNRDNQDYESWGNLTRKDELRKFLRKENRKLFWLANLKWSCQTKIKRSRNPDLRALVARIVSHIMLSRFK